MTRTKKCEICGAMFETAYPNKRYCCLTCREAARLLRRKEWNEKNRDYSREYMRAYRRTRKWNGAKTA